MLFTWRSSLTIANVCSIIDITEIYNRRARIVCKYSNELAEIVSEYAVLPPYLKVAYRDRLLLLLYEAAALQDTTCQAGTV